MHRIRTTILAVMLCTATTIFSAEPFVMFTPQVDALSLQQSHVSVSADEPKAVRIAVRNLQEDLLKVTGHKPTIDSGQSADGNGWGTTIVVGTVGYSKKIDQLVKNGTLKDLRGRREKYILTTVDGQLVIAGSDRRGTVYGIYELSRQIGVSPWYWWMDVPVRRRDYVGVLPGCYSDGEPAVEFRGLFLNDEAPCLTSWVKNTFGTDYGDHRFYSKVFELILRLKGNMLWPAMWGWAFYADDPENSRTADDMGIIMGTSHHEPMARNHQEYARNRSNWGPWNYERNGERLDQFFREGIERMKGTEDMVTIGMRGDGDEAMSEDADTRLLQRIVKRQRRIISEITGKPASKTTQVWALYKEVLDYYDKGMRVPEDVIMLLCDDNWGNVRRLPNAKEREHPGGWGLYYHVDYVGAPRNSKWLNVTPSQNMWEQLTLAYEGGIRRMWILNVGDLKPMEYPITLFLDMAWRPEAVGRDLVATHTMEFCRQVLGEDKDVASTTASGATAGGGLAEEAARLLNLCCKMNGRCTAELLDRDTYNVRSGEWRLVADEYMRLEAEALRLYLRLEEWQRDAYEELILFPIQAMSNIYQMYYAQAMNWMLYETNDPDCNVWAQRVEECFQRDGALCQRYNKVLAGGKWDGMMTQKHIGYSSWNDDFEADRMPEVKRLVDWEPGGFVFSGEQGYVAMEAEHFFNCVPAMSGTQDDNTKAGNGKASRTVKPVDRGRHWVVIPDMGRTRSGMALMPYSEPTDGAGLEYRFQTEHVAEVKVHVVVKSTLDFRNKGGMTYKVCLDGHEARVNFNGNLNEDKENVYSVYYPTVARRVVESVVTLPLDGSVDVHSLWLVPEDGGIVFEKVVVDAGGYVPSYLFMEESPRCRSSALPRP